MTLLHNFFLVHGTRKTSADVLLLVWGPREWMPALGSRICALRPSGCDLVRSAQYQVEAIKKIWLSRLTFTLPSCDCLYLFLSENELASGAICPPLEDRDIAGWSVHAWCSSMRRR